MCQKSLVDVEGGLRAPLLAKIVDAIPAAPTHDACLKCGGKLLPAAQKGEHSTSNEYYDDSTWKQLILRESQSTFLAHCWMPLGCCTALLCHPPHSIIKV
jgi:hypothetical protein